MTANGSITVTDVTAPSTIFPVSPANAAPLHFPPISYMISFPVAGGGTNFQSSGPQNFTWPWFDHSPFGGTNGPLSRSIKYDISGTISDTVFSNNYPVTQLSRTFVVDVSPTKVNSISASQASYPVAAFFGTLADVFGAFAAGLSAIPVAAGVLTVLGLGSAGFSAWFTSMGSGQQANAADPPSIDKDYIELFPFKEEEIGNDLPNSKELANLRRFSIACGIVTRIVPAISATEGRIAGARQAKDSVNVRRQQDYLQRLLKAMIDASQRAGTLSASAVLDVDRVMNNQYRPVTTKDWPQRLTTYSRSGLPPTATRALTSGGMSRRTS